MRADSRSVLAWTFNKQLKHTAVYTDVRRSSSLHKVFVRSNAGSMYGKMMRHIHIADHQVESDDIVWFRTSDDTVSEGLQDDGGCV